MLGVTSPVIVGCSADGGVFASRSAEPITQEAVLDGYKSATAVLTGSLDTVAMDDATLTRLFEIYDNAIESYKQQYDDTADENNIVLMGDVVSNEDAAFINELYRAHSIDQRVDVGDDTAQQVDLFYYALASSLSGSKDVTEEALAGVDELVQPEKVQLDAEAERATILIGEFATGDTENVQMVYADRMWKLATTREGVSEMSGFVGFMLSMMMSSTEGETSHEKAAQLVQDLREHQREIAEMEASEAAEESEPADMN